MGLLRTGLELGRFLDETDGIAQSEELFDLLSAFALNFDCPWIAYGPLASDQKVLNPAQPDSTAMLSYPDGWKERYVKMGYDKIDPIIKKSRNRIDAVQWSEVYRDASTTENERRVLDEAAAFGLKSGVTVPLHGPAGSFTIMSFAQPWSREFQNRTTTYLQLAALHFHVRITELGYSNRLKHVNILSFREKECMLWTARGKSSWEIGRILGISANTVNFHLKNAMRKLDTANRTAAAIKATNLRIIEI